MITCLPALMHYILQTIHVHVPIHAHGIYLVGLHCNGINRNHHAGPGIVLLGINS